MESGGHLGSTADKCLASLNLENVSPKEGVGGSSPSEAAILNTRGTKMRLSPVFPTQREGKVFLREIRRDGSRLRHELVSNLTSGEWFCWLCENDWPESIDPKTLRGQKAWYRKYAEERRGYDD